MEIVMCDPGYYDIKYEINPWMEGNILKVDAGRAREQWENLEGKLKESGVGVHVIEPQKDCPDMVFTANLGIVLGNTFIASNFRNRERRKELPYAIPQIIEKYSLDYDQCPYPWEGEAELFHVKDNIYIGSYGIRGVKDALDWLGKEYSLDIIKMRLANKKFYHLDTCLTIREDEIFLYEKAFDKKSLNRLKSRFDYFNVPKGMAESFGLNSIQAGEWITNRIEDDARKEFESSHKNIRLAELDMSEFMKAGGSCFCMTLTIRK